MVSKVMKNDEGVSAVIGVILMVAITVILAAVIAAFVFSMSNNVGTTYTVAVTAKKLANGDIIITNSGGADVSKLKSVAITIQPKDATSATPVTTTSTTLIGVGSTFTIHSGTPVTFKDPNHVVVTGTFQDGASQVLIAADV